MSFFLLYQQSEKLMHLADTFNVVKYVLHRHSVVWTPYLWTVWAMILLFDIYMQ